MIPNQPKKKKKVKVMVRKSKSDAKPAALKERSQIQVIAKAAQNNAKAGDKSVGQFTRAAIKGGLSRGDVKFKGKLGFKSADPSKMGGTILKKDFKENLGPGYKAPKGTKDFVMTHKKGELDPRKPQDAQVASHTGVDPKSIRARVLRSVDKVSETAIVSGSSRKDTLKQFKTGSGKKPKDPRRRKIKVL